MKLNQTDFPRGRVFALSDIHGCYKIYERVKDFLLPQDTVFFLGDAGDRGPRPWDCIKAIYNDSQFVYLKGNHEDMLRYAIKHYPYDAGALEWNGGMGTLNEWASDKTDINWENALRNLPVIAWYTNKKKEIILMSHSGYIHPDFKMTSDCGLDYVSPGQDNEYLWNRHILNKLEWDKDSNTYIVHGHSPVPICFHNLKTEAQLEKWMPDMHCYCDGHMIDIDLGTHYTGWACLLNLDTWDEHYFETDERI